MLDHRLWTMDDNRKETIDHRPSTMAVNCFCWVLRLQKWLLLGLFLTDQYTQLSSRTIIGHSRSPIVHGLFSMVDRRWSALLFPWSMVGSFPNPVHPLFPGGLSPLLIHNPRFVITQVQKPKPNLRTSRGQAPAEAGSVVTLYTPFFHRLSSMVGSFDGR
jgi:hypothetical protein